MVRVVCTTCEIVWCVPQVRLLYLMPLTMYLPIQLVSKICTICTVDVTLVIVIVPNSTVSILG